MSDIKIELALTGIVSFCAGTVSKFICKRARTVRNLLKSMLNGLVWVGLTAPVTYMLFVEYNNLFRCCICVFACVFVGISKEKEIKLTPHVPVVASKGVLNEDKTINTQTNNIGDNKVQSTTTYRSDPTSSVNIKNVDPQCELNNIGGKNYYPDKTTGQWRGF